ncbi:MAG: hypothetical protein ABIT37_01590 [Luteolibacter sp.]
MKTLALLFALASTAFAAQTPTFKPAGQTTANDFTATNHFAGNSQYAGAISYGIGTTFAFDTGVATLFKAAAGLTPGANVQAYDPDLTTYAGIPPAANVQSFLGAANYGAMKTLLTLNNVDNTSDVNKPVSSLTSTALGLKVDLTQLSTIGGPGKVMKADSNGDFVAGVTTASNDLLGLGGNLWMPNRRGLRWYKTDGTGSGYFIQPNEEHDGYGGELFIQAPWRIALLAHGPIQVGLNDPVRYPICFEMTTGAATATDTMKASYPITYLTKTWNSGSPSGGQVIQQAWPVNNNGTNPVFRTYMNGIVWGKDGGAPDATTGNATGDLVSEIDVTGTWTPGLAPAFVSLTDGATITQTCSKYKSVQVASVQLGGNRTLALSGQLAGQRGVIYVQQDATGSRTLTLPNGSATPSSWALSTAAFSVDRLAWEFDGVYIYWTMTAGITLPFDTDADAFLTRASITSIPADNTKRTAINNLTLSLKGAGLWSKLDCIYPFVGGNATAHSKNLKANAYNMTWTGGITHDANGITGNGTTGYGLTGYAFSANGGQNDSAGGVYNKTASPNQGYYFFGTIKANGNFAMWRSYNGAGEILWTDGLNNNATTDNGLFPTGPDFRGHLFASRFSSSQWLSGMAGPGATSKTTKTVSSTGVSDYPVAVLGTSNSASTANQLTNANLAFAWFGRALTGAECDALTTIITAYETALGRQN